MARGWDARRAAAAAASPVTPAQVRALIVEARRAWAAQRRLGLAEEPFDEWRRAALWDCCRESSFRKLDQGGFDLARPYFRKLAMADGAPFDEAAEQEAGDLRRALFSFRGLCRRYDAEGLFAPGSAAAYCDEIARDTWKRPVAELPADKVRLVSLTLAARAAAKRAARRRANAECTMQNAQCGNREPGTRNREPANFAQNRAEGGGRENVRPGGAAR